MKPTQNLIAELADDLKPVTGNVRQRWIVAGTFGGAFAALILLIALLGMRSDLAFAMASPGFWMKIGYTGTLTIVALAAAAVLARPEAEPPVRLWLVLVPVIVLAALSATELLGAEPAARRAMVMGQTWRSCPLNIVALALPVFAALVLAFRRLAPTRLRLTGAVIGLASGAAGATIYCLHCPEVSASFVMTWYTLGIVAAALLGALTGPRLLRW